MLPDHAPPINSNGRAAAEPSPAAANGPQPPARPAYRIEAEPAERINVAAGGKLIVPREDIDGDVDDGAEMELAHALKIRKPGRHEWVLVRPDEELATRLLPHKPTPDSIQTEYYYIDPTLRAPIADELKHVRVIPYYSVSAQAFAIWIINVTPDNSWYESIAALLRQPADFLATNAVRIISTRGASRYRVRAKPMTIDVPWPNRDTGELLGEALGPDRMIRTADHPIYRQLIEGTELV